MLDGMSMPVLSAEDYKKWDYLPKAADEMKDYLEHLLADVSMPYEIETRAKSITSFLTKCQKKKYEHPMKDVKDFVAARIITDSVLNREKACGLIRKYLQCVEESQPGAAEHGERRGYDSVHFIVKGELVPTGWMIHDGALEQYFGQFEGLEIQVRTVAAHAWAEFEHEYRYKGTFYDTMGPDDKKTINDLLCQAADDRQRLDDAFDKIVRILAQSDAVVGQDTAALDQRTLAETRHDPLTVRAMHDLLEDRFPDDSDASQDGLRFAIELAAACGLNSRTSLSAALDDVDADQVRRLMETTVHVTRVRRLDDELLALCGQRYIDATKTIGSDPWVANREDILRWRYDRLRGKLNIYQIIGADRPSDLRVPLSATRALRETVRILADRNGADTVLVPDVVSTEPLPQSLRPREVTLADGTSLWVATKTTLAQSEAILRELLARRGTVDIDVTKSGGPLPQPVS